MIIAIIGGRDFNDPDLIERSLSDVVYQVELVISTGSQDKDSLAKCWAQEKEVEHIEFVQSPATNEMLIKICTHVVIFGEVGNLVDLAKKYKKRYRIITAIVAVKS